VNQAAREKEAVEVFHKEWQALEGALKQALPKAP
jgi:hypothetical protein